MATKTLKSQYFEGFRYGLAFILVIVPFGMLFGIVATEAGLNLAQVMVMTVAVIAGASQFAALSQMMDNAPIFMVLVTSLAVNMRMAMYSAAMVPHLGKAKLWQKALVAYLLVDQSGVVAAEKYSKEEMTIPEKLSYFWGVITPIAPVWYAATLLGALVGGRIPEAFAIDFAMPITFIALIAPMVRTLAHLAAATTSVILALLLGFIPYSFGLIIAAIGAMAMGSLVEVLQERRAAQ